MIGFREGILCSHQLHSISPDMKSRSTKGWSWASSSVPRISQASSAVENIIGGRSRLIRPCVTDPTARPTRRWNNTPPSSDANAIVGIRTMLVRRAEGGRGGSARYGTAVVVRKK